MNKNNVPQDSAILGQWHEISYAVDQEGQYTLVASAGWEPANIANQQAWLLIHEQLEQVEKKVQAGELSPIAYFMAKHQMDTRLLAKYVGLPHWRVKRHLKPAVFSGLKVPILVVYADLFGITVQQLAAFSAGEASPS
jgi:hypothetical protein